MAKANNNRHTGADKALAALARAKRSTPVSVQRVNVIGEDAASVLFHIPTHGKRINEEELASSISELFDNKVRLLGGSAHFPTKSGDLVLAFVSRNHDMRSYDADSVKGWTNTTANVFRDENDDIWTKVGEGEEAMLVKKSDDDLDQLLSRRHSTSLVTASVGVSLSEKAKVGEAIGWYDFRQEAMRFGIKLTDRWLFDVATSSVCEVDPEAVVLATHIRPDIAVDISKASASVAGLTTGSNGEPLSRANMIQRHLSYMAILYKNHPQYFDKLKGLLSQGFSASAVAGF